MPTLQNLQRQPALGVSLIEALVALAVMSFGMLALIGVQNTMRINTDLARQTTEATRMVTEDLEALRLFNDVRAVTGQATASWDELAGRTDTVQLPGNTGNVTFSLSRQLFDFPVRPDTMSSLNLLSSQAKIAQTTVTWTDRTDGLRTVRMQSVVAAAAPALSGLVNLPPYAGVVTQRDARHVSIPVTARDLGNGKSAYKPPGSSTVVWVFNNVTGRITQRCPAVTAAQSAITAAAVADCPAIGYGSLVDGHVLFHLAPPPTGGYTALQSERPQGIPTGEIPDLNSSTPLSIDVSTVVGLVSPYTECFSGDAYIAAGSGATRANTIPYSCLIYMDSAAGWGGKLNVSVSISSWQITSLPGVDATANRYRVCRYTRAESDYTLNRDHPKTYCKIESDTCVSANRVTRNLTNQNFLVLGASGVCPSDIDNNPDSSSGQDPLLNANTRAHQPS